MVGSAEVVFAVRFGAAVRGAAWSSPSVPARTHPWRLSGRCA